MIQASAENKQAQIDREIIGVYREINGYFVPKISNDHRFDFSGYLVIGRERLKGSFTDIFGKSDIDGIVLNNKNDDNELYCFTKTYTTHLNSENNLFYVLKRTDKADEYSGSYYYIYNKDLSPEELVKFAKPKKKNANLGYGGSCLCILKNQISPKDIQELRNYMMTPPRVTDIEAYLEDIKKRVHKSTLGNLFARKQQEVVVREMGF